jgi:predicted SnoaL-like aldol condensation-catalyzing enzyme
MEKEQLQSSTNTNTKQQEEEEEDKNEALALRYHNDIFQKGKLEVADEILSPDFVLHNPTLPEGLRNGPEGAKKYASAVIAAVPDRKLVHDDILSKGDKVLIRWTNSGTNTGPLFGNPPTGKTICRNRL